MRVFSELVRSIQRNQAELVLAIEEKQRQTERWAQCLLTDLEKEIDELKRRNADLENMARTDHIHFLKVEGNVPGLNSVSLCFSRRHFTPFPLCRTSLL